MSNTDFPSLGINQSLHKKLQLMDIEVPTPVQKKTIPLVLEDKNLLVQSPTGTGKTIAYIAPLLMKINKTSNDLEVIILVPSRELAMQTVRVGKELAEEGTGFAVLIGGANPKRQLEYLRNKPKIVVGTPGRILELLRKRKINGQTIKTIVVDEVDKMLSQGFFDDVKGILKSTLKTRQTLFYSATTPKEILRGLPELMESPVVVQMRDDAGVPTTIEHQYLTVGKKNKFITLGKLLKIYNSKKVMVFMQKNEGTEPLANLLTEKGIVVGALHSDLPQNLRKNIMENFRKGKIKVLVTTDLLARGIDIPGVDYIINYDLPMDEKHYLHRAGRTGRAGKKGTAITLVYDEQRFIMRKYARMLNIRFNHMALKDDTVIPVQYQRNVKKNRGDK